MTTRTPFRSLYSTSRRGVREVLTRTISQRDLQGCLWVIATNERTKRRRWLSTTAELATIRAGIGQTICWESRYAQAP